jgi:hypothetical protein
MLLKISDRLAQAFGINLSRLFPGFVGLFCCVPRACWLSAPLASCVWFEAYLFGISGLANGWGRKR